MTSTDVHDNCDDAGRPLLPKPVTGRCPVCDETLEYIEEVPTRRTIDGVVDGTLNISGHIQGTYDDGTVEYLHCRHCIAEYSLDGIDIGFDLTN